MRIAVATASNDIYFDSLNALLKSLAGFEHQGRVSTHVLDVGLNDTQRETLRAAGHQLARPDWDVDVSPDGQRFLWSVVSTTDAGAPQAPIRLVLNWTSGLK